MQGFFAMGGYAFYVWSSFGLGLVSVVYLYVSAKSLQVKKLKEVRVWQAREAQRKNKQAPETRTEV